MIYSTLGLPGAAFLARLCHFYGAHAGTLQASQFTEKRATDLPGGGVEAAALALLLSGAHMHRVLMSASSLFLVRSSRCNLHFVFRM